MEKHSQQDTQWLAHWVSGWWRLRLGAARRPEAGLPEGLLTPDSLSVSPTAFPPSDIIWRPDSVLFESPLMKQWPHPSACKGFHFPQVVYAFLSLPLSLSPFSASFLEKTGISCATL